MAHVNSHKEPRRAKMLDLANKSVKGSVGGNRHAAKQFYHQWIRTYERQTYRHLRDFRCSGDVECDCPGCSCELWNTAGGRNLRPEPGWAYPVIDRMRDDLGGARRSAEKWALRLGSSDAFLSWLKRNYPDTVAGRHAVDHIMSDMPRSLGCVCEIDWEEHGPKGNHGQCTCGAFLAKVNLCRADLSGEDLSGEDLSDVDLSEADLSETNLSGANLFRANLACSNLYNANLAGVNLSRAILYKANLEGADLTGADLTWARACADTVWPAGFGPGPASFWRRNRLLCAW